MKESFVFYRSFYEASRFLSDEEKGRLFDMICQYGLYWNEIEWTWPAMWMFLLIKPQLDANYKRYVNWCKWWVYWKLWWRPKKTWDNSQKPQDNPNLTPNDNDNVNDNVNVNVNENENISAWNTPSIPDNIKEKKEKVAAKERKEKKSKKRIDYTEDYENIWRIYPHNHCVKQDVYWLWQQYSEEEKARLLIWAQIEELKWDYVNKWKTRMSNRMDRWMDSYTLTKDWIPEFVDIVDKLNNIQDEQTRKEWLDKAREYFGEDYVRTALSKVTKKITLEFH